MWTLGELSDIVDQWRQLGGGGRRPPQGLYNEVFWAGFFLHVWTLYLCMYVRTYVRTYVGYARIRTCVSWYMQTLRINVRIRVFELVRIHARVPVKKTFGRPPKKTVNWRHCRWWGGDSCQKMVVVLSIKLRFYEGTQCQQNFIKSASAKQYTTVR